jgi:hypothetical protein
MREILPAAKLVDFLWATRRSFGGRPLLAGPPRDIDLILDLPPSIEKQRLDRPFIGEIFEEIADESDCLILRYH